MASILDNTFRPDHNNINEWVNIREYAIGGKMIIAHMSVPEYLDIPGQEIKSRLARLLSERILQDNLAEFTYMNNTIGSSRDYKARCYLAKDGDIKILRTYG